MRESNSTKGSGFKRLVESFRDWLERRRARQIYLQICKANYLILKELHGNRHSKPFQSELEHCADALELAACQVKRRFDTDA